MLCTSSTGRSSKKRSNGESVICELFSQVRDDPITHTWWSGACRKEFLSTTNCVHLIYCLACTSHHQQEENYFLCEVNAFACLILGQRLPPSPSPLGEQNISLADVFSGGFWVCWVVSFCNTTDKVFSDKSSWQVRVWRGIWLSDVRGMQETYHGEAHNSLCVCVCIYRTNNLYSNHHKAIILWVHFCY